MPPREPHRPPAGNEPPAPATGSGVRPISDVWTCGHTAGAMCQECYRELAAKAHELAKENLELRQQIEGLQRHIVTLNDRVREELNFLMRRTGL